MTTPRIAPVGRGTIPSFAWLAAQAGGKASGTQPMNLFLALGRHGRLFKAWLPFAGLLMPGGVLKRRETEMIILRVARARNCEYEYDHHVRIGKRAGVDAKDVEIGPSAEVWSERERAILVAVDQLLAEHDLDDDTWAKLREHIDEREAIELCFLVGHYEMLATTIQALRIPRDVRANATK